VGSVHVLVICDGRAESHNPDELPVLHKREDALVWVDVPVGDRSAGQLLSEVFGFHSIAVGDCVERDMMPWVPDPPSEPGHGTRAQSIFVGGGEHVRPGPWS
jgi:hypothetical protein